MDIFTVVNYSMADMNNFLYRIVKRRNTIVATLNNDCVDLYRFHFYNLVNGMFYHKNKTFHVVEK